MPKKKKPFKRKTKKASELKTVRQLARSGQPKVVIRARQQQILKMYSQGKPIEQIAVELGMQAGAVTRNLNTAIDRMIQHYAMSTPQQTFVRYAAFQMNIVQKLQRTYERYINDPDVKQYNAAIQALRGMSDIYDKVMEQGYAYGVIERKKADRQSIEGKAQDIRGELVAEVVQLTRLIETIDDSTQGKAMLQGRPPLTDQQPGNGVSGAVRTSITYTRIIRKPMRNEFGIVRAIPDWKYRTKLYAERSDGKYVEQPISNLTPEQKESLAPHDPDRKLHEQLAKEQGKQLVTTADGHSFLIEKEKLSPITETTPSNLTAPIPDTITKPTREQSSWLVKPVSPSHDMDTE